MSTALRDAVVVAFARITTDPASVDVLIPLYADDLRFQDPIQTTTGRDAFLDINRRIAARAKALSFVVERVTGDDDEFFLTWRLEVRPRRGPVLAIEGASHLRAAAGRVTYQRDYWDLATSLAAMVPGGTRALRLLLRPLA